jgi:hypothetical protein
MQAAGGWVKADGELNRVNVSESPSAEVQDVLKAEKRLQFISLVKSVASAVVGVFLVFKLIVPTIVFLTFSLAISALSVTKHFFKANMIYKPLSDWKIAAPAA